MKSQLQRLLLLAIIAITGVIATHTTAVSQEEYTYTCIIVNGCKVLITFDKCGNIVSEESDCGSEGTGVFASPTSNEEIEEQKAAGKVDVSLTPVSIETSVNDPALGTVTTTLDATRTAPATTIVSNTEEGAFPATATIQFYANATLEANGDIVYASRDPLVFVADVNSLAPFEDETFTLANDVDFYDPNDEARNTAFRLRAGETTVTLGAAADGEGNGEDLR